MPENPTFEVPSEFENSKDLLAKFSLLGHRTGIRQRDEFFFPQFDESRVQLRELLEQTPDELRLQKYLEEHPVLLAHAALGGFYSVASVRSALFAQVGLGRELQMDFAYCTGNSAGVYWTFIELERPDVPIFTKAGDPSKQLSHALRQILDWTSWLQQHQEYARHILDDLIRSSPMRWGWSDVLYRKPSYMIIIGRRASLNPETNRRRAQLCDQYHGLEIVTWDRLLDDYRGGDDVPFENSRLVSEGDVEV